MVRTTGQLAAIVMLAFIVLVLYVVAGGTLPGGSSKTHPCGPSISCTKGP